MALDRRGRTQTDSRAYLAHSGRIALSFDRIFDDLEYALLALVQLHALASLGEHSFGLWQYRTLVRPRQAHAAFPTAGVGVDSPLGAVLYSPLLRARVRVAELADALG